MTIYNYTGFILELIRTILNVILINNRTKYLFLVIKYISGMRRLTQMRWKEQSMKEIMMLTLKLHTATPKIGLIDELIPKALQTQWDITIPNIGLITLA